MALDGSIVEPHTLSARAVLPDRPRQGGAVAFGGSISVPTTLYRFFDSAGRLLYIGVTSVGPSRWSEHEHHRKWWALVARVEAEHFPDRASALAAEKAAIKAEQPPWNIQHRLPRNPKQLPKTRRHGTGTVIERDGRWSFICRIGGRQKWINVRTEAEARLLLACFEHRAVTRSTREKAAAILEAGADWDGTVPLF
jgi:predicted GIY-YIG superfamily endonuclease